MVGVKVSRSKAPALRIKSEKTFQNGLICDTVCLTFVRAERNSKDRSHDVLNFYMSLEKNWFLMVEWSEFFRNRKTLRCLRLSSAFDQWCAKIKSFQSMVEKCDLAASLW